MRFFKKKKVIEVKIDAGVTNKVMEAHKTILEDFVKLTEGMSKDELLTFYGPLVQVCTKCIEEVSDTGNAITINWLHIDTIERLKKSIADN